MGRVQLIKLMRFLTNPYYGLTQTEVILLRWSQQSYLAQPEFTPSDMPNYLAGCVADAREGFVEMRQQFGSDYADPDAPADREYDYSDLVEKLQRMDPEKAKQIYYFFIGYHTAWESDE